MRWLLILVVFIPGGLLGQSHFDVSFEFQAYPTGLIPGIRLEKSLNNNSSAHLRLGYNWIRHRDLGQHDDERGDGYGFSIGYKRYLSEDKKGFSLCIKNDFWWNSIDWKDESDTSGQVDLGTSEITVIQPTLELGYTILTKSLIFTPSLAFGFEWNVRTVGEPTGEGAILLVGFQLGKRF